MTSAIKYSVYGHFAQKTIFRAWYKSRDYVVGTRREPKYTLLRRYHVPRWQIWEKPGRDVLVYRPKQNSE